MSFAQAVAVRDNVRSALELAGIQARCAVTLGDSGPRVDVFVSPRDLERAKKALPPVADSGSVILHKAVQPQR